MRFQCGNKRNRPFMVNGSYRHFFTVCLLGYTSLDTFISHDYSHPYE